MSSPAEEASSSLTQATAVSVQANKGSDESAAATAAFAEGLKELIGPLTKGADENFAAVETAQTALVARVEALHASLLALNASAPVSSDAAAAKSATSPAASVDGAVSPGSSSLSPVGVGAEFDAVVAAACARAEAVRKRVATAAVAVATLRERTDRIYETARNRHRVLTTSLVGDAPVTPATGGQ
eukprot:TRINITY_DN2473_c0_g1_i1.p2 TRINITY_DN2473_c0_g1~~TRINITY_DN2473_c0_g1_i1.p2  ORF type:complete len:186 (-),score=28.26 TRINITY_DN2473_c0_g1_i1:247-804(-)